VAVLASAVAATAVHAPIAAAQAPGQVVGEATSAPFLEKRVPDELATEGVVLSRQGLSLQVEQIGNRWLVSLVDLNTGRVAASTKVDNLPPDREAAVAMMTHVVADLATQVIVREPPPPAQAAPPAPPIPPTPPVDLNKQVRDAERAEREAHERAELKFNRHSLRFDATYEIVSYGQGGYGLSRQLVAYQGDLNEVLDVKDFYTQVGRLDLYSQYQNRRRAMIGFYVAAGIAAAVSLVFFTQMFSSGGSCDSAQSDCIDQQLKQEDDNFKTYGTLTLVAGGVAAGAWLIGLWYHFHPHPITENEAKSLADVYNQHLRQQLGLPVVSRSEPILRDLKLAPYASGSGAGIGLSAQF
jgi:hypothetical protein